MKPYKLRFYVSAADLINAWAGDSGEKLKFVDKNRSWIIQLMSVFFWFLGRRRSWMDSTWVAGIPFTGRTIFVPTKRVKGMGTAAWAGENIHTLRHEFVHILQRETDGTLTFTWRYLTSQNWRAAYESEAFMTRMEKYEHAPVMGAHHIARTLRSVYLISIPERVLVDRLSALWREYQEVRDNRWKQR